MTWDVINYTVNIHDVRTHGGSTHTDAKPVQIMIFFDFDIRIKINYFVFKGLIDL